MKKIFLFFLCVLLPVELVAMDHCTNPNKYTVDKRCYVTESQGTKKPFNAVVALVYPVVTRLLHGQDDIPYCTGTMVKLDDGKPYLFTAKHCTDVASVLFNDGKSNNTLRIRLLDGTKKTVTHVRDGEYNIKQDTNRAGDYAIYALDADDNIKTVDVSKRKASQNHKASIIGYGMLKIMSDAEIRNFKTKYKKFLKDNYRINVNYTDADGIEISAANKYIQQFINTDYGRSILSDGTKLKMSECRYVEGLEDGCQVWSGNSGGGIFDADGNIMGIHTRGSGVVGGPNHASGTRNVPLLKWE